MTAMIKYCMWYNQENCAYAGPLPRLRAHGRGANMEIFVSDISDYKVVTISGEINFANVNLFREEIKGIIGDKPLNLVIDLGNLFMIDSTGIAALYAVHKKVAALKGSFYLANMNEIVENIIALTGIKFKTIGLKGE